MVSKFTSGKHIYITLDNGKEGDQREELQISFLLGDDCGWYIWLTLKMPRATYEFVDCEIYQHVSKTDPFVWCKIVRMAIRDMVMKKLGIREPMTFLRSNDYSWMDRIDSTTFAKEKWHTVKVSPDDQ